MALSTSSDKRVSSALHLKDTLLTKTQEDQSVGSCPDASRECLQGFYQREEIAKQQIQGLNGHIMQLSAALQHAGYISQQDRKALNKSHDHIEQLEKGFHQSESTRARIENELHDVTHEFRLCMENLAHERKRHIETEKNLDCIWNAQNQLRCIISDVKFHRGDSNDGLTYDVEDLVLQITAKWQRIQDLEVELKQQKEERTFDVNRYEELLQKVHTRHAEESDNHVKRIRELELLLQREKMSSPIGDQGMEPGEPSKRRRRCRGRGNGSTDTRQSTEVQSSDGGGPQIKQEPI